MTFGFVLWFWITELQVTNCKSQHVFLLFWCFRNRTIYHLHIHGYVELASKLQFLRGSACFPFICPHYTCYIKCEFSGETGRELEVERGGEIVNRLGGGGRRVGGERMCMEVLLTHINVLGKFFPLVALQQSTKERMETFLSSSFALFLLVGFFDAVLTDEAQTRGYSLSSSTIINNTSTTTITSTSVTTGPAIVLDANTTAPTTPVITTTSRGKQSQSGSGRSAGKGKEEKEKSSEDDKPGKRADCRLNLIVFPTLSFYE